MMNTNSFLWEILLLTSATRLQINQMMKYHFGICYLAEGMRNSEIYLCSEDCVEGLCSQVAEEPPVQGVALALLP